jgi:hypothetical protein
VRRLLSDPYRFVSTGGNDRYLRTPDGWSRRKVPVADRGLGRLSWADCGPSRAAFSRPGVRSEAGFRVVRGSTGLDAKWTCRYRPRRTTRASWRTPEGHCDSGREWKSRRLITPGPPAHGNRLSHVLFSALDRRSIWPARLDRRVERRACIPGRRVSSVQHGNAAMPETINDIALAFLVSPLSSFAGML